MDEIILYVNIFPILILYLISKIEQEIETRKELFEIATGKLTNEEDKNG
jgi:hypothetical protein